MANKHCRKFEEHDDYINAINNNELSIHTVSYCKDEKDLHYDSDLFLVECVFNVTDISQPTTILNDLSSVNSIKVDGVLLSQVTKTFQFQRTGLHYVKYSLKTLPALGGRLPYNANAIFHNVSTLIGFKVNNDITAIMYSSFSSTNLLNINISKNITRLTTDINIGTPFSNCFDTINTITVDPDNTVYDSRNNCNAIIETSTNTLIFGCKNTVIPNTVTKIGEYAFYLNKLNPTIFNLQLPESLTYLGRGALSIPIETIHIPASLIDFYELNNDHPEYNEIPISNRYLNTITVDPDNTVFDSRNNCNALIHTATNTLLLGGKNTVIPNTITKIGKCAFRNPEITSITIPSSVTYILISSGTGPFNNCSGLETFIFLSDLPPTITQRNGWLFNPSTHTNLLAIYVPDNSINAYKTALSNVLSSDFLNLIVPLSTMP